MTISEILQYLRLNVNVLLPSGVTDPAFMEMTDDELTLYLKLALAQPYFAQQGIEDLSGITGSSIYALVLFAKRELYSFLAVRAAKSTQMTAGEVSMSKGERYSHYADLMRLCDDEIEKLTSGQDASLGGTGGIAYTYTYGTPNRPVGEKHSQPAIGKLKLINVGAESITFSWSYPRSFMFSHADVYVGTQPILISDGFDTDISETATKAGSTTDPNKTSFVAGELTPETAYYTAVIVYDKLGSSSYAQLSATTLEVT